MYLIAVDDFLWSIVVGTHAIERSHLKLKKFTVNLIKKKDIKKFIKQIKQNFIISSGLNRINSIVYCIMYSHYL